MIDFFKEEEYEPGYSTEDKVIFGSLAVGGVTILLGMIVYSYISVQNGGLMMILGLLISILPYGIVSFLRNRAISEMERQFPAFLKDLAESKRGGMTVLRSFESAKETDYGRLNQEIEKVHNQLSWGIPFPEVMERFSRRVEDSPVIQESLSIILQSYRSGGNITETIESVADNATMLREVIREKKSALKQQLVIMYVIYFLFIGITVGVYFLMQQLLGLGSPEPGTIENVGQLLGGEGGATNFCSGEIGYADPFCGIAQVFGFVPGNITDLGSGAAEEMAYGQMAYYKSVLFAMLMIQGASSAAVAGQISEGSPSAGIKHALIMLPVAFAVYMYLIRPMGF
ncbi:MAG: type II secretion system F family protein [Candidatus Nanohaloarchaea archaeon]